MRRRLSSLSTKLLRDLWRLRAQALAIAAVTAAGVGMVIMSFGMIRSLEASRAAYYAQYHFADLFAPVRRAPDAVVPRLRQIPGVAMVQSRISAGALLDLPGMAEPVAARIHSLPTGDAALNALVLRSGRFPASGRGDEAVANEAFAQAARLSLRDRFTALVYGREIRLRLVGTVLSPEYVYAVAPGQIFPDNRRFGILWMARRPLAGALDLTDAFNEAVLTLAPDAEPTEVIRRLDLALAPFGAAGAYGRDRQISDRFVANEIDQLRTMVRILPPIFLVVAAFLLNIVLTRLVDTEREVIGLLKAFGYRDGAILGHYAALALLLAVPGLLLGCLLGSTLGRALAVMYQRFFSFPFLSFHAGLDVYLIGCAAALLAVTVGAAASVRRAARLMPAEAMHPPVPQDFSGRAARLAGALGPDEPSRIILRGLLRRPLRTGLTVTGLAAALALYVASASSTDNVDRMITLAFQRADRSDLVVSFAEPRDARALHELRRLPGVLRVEPFRAAAARLRHGGRAETEGLSGGNAGGDLSRTVDMAGAVVEPPPRGAILSTRLARQLAVAPGGELEIAITEGERQRFRLPVASVIETPLGSSAGLDRRALNRLLREGETLSGAYLAVDQAALDRLYAALKRMPLVAGISLRDATLHSIRDTIAENMGIITLFNSGFAALIVLGIVYNSARITLSERARDLASLRVLGFRRREVAFVLLGEQALLVLLSLPLGIGLGMALSFYITGQFSADLYTIPFAMSAATLAKGVLVVCAAAALTAVLIRNRVDRLDLVRALKTRE